MFAYTRLLHVLTNTCLNVYWTFVWSNIEQHRTIIPKRKAERLLASSVYLLKQFVCNIFTQENYKLRALTYSLRQGSSLEKWKVQLWTNFSKWGLSKGRRCLNFKTDFKSLFIYSHVWCLVQPLLLYLCCRITLYDYQALCKEYTGSSDSAHTLSDVSDIICGTLLYIYSDMTT